MHPGVEVVLPGLPGPDPWGAGRAIKTDFFPGGLSGPRLPFGRLLLPIASPECSACSDTLCLFITVQSSGGELGKGVGVAVQTTLIPPFSPEEEDRGVELPGLELSAGPSLAALLVGALERFLATDRESAAIIV